MLAWVGLNIFLLPLNGKAQFKLDTEIRPRVEFRDGVKTLLTTSDQPALVVSQRTRLSLSFKSENLSVGIEPQDVRIWGDEVYKTDIPTLGLNQAYADFKFSTTTSIKIGRQNLSYDNKRLLGPRNWNNVGASHDVAVLKFQKETLNAHLGYAINNDSDVRKRSEYTADYYKYLSYLWLNKTTNKLSLSFMTIADGLQSSTDALATKTRVTSGIYCKASLNNQLGMESTFYYQFGQTPDNLPISAYYFALIPSYQLNKNIKLLIGSEYFSGDDALNNNSTYNSFDKLYGDAHGLYGYMDYFTEIPKHTKGGGLLDLYAQVSFSKGGKTSFETTVHEFRLTNTIADSNNLAADRQLGIELDLAFKHKFQPWVELSGGYSTMLASTTMEIIKGGSAQKFQQWAWLMFTFKPTLFSEN